LDFIEKESHSAMNYVLRHWSGSDRQVTSILHTVAAFLKIDEENGTAVLKLL
jgi:hypothetical protein